MAAFFLAENFATRLGLSYSVMNPYAITEYPSTYSGVVALSLLEVA